MDDSKPTTKDDVMWELLLDIKEDLKSFDQKLDSHVISVAEDRMVLKELYAQVRYLNKLVVQGNGQTSIINQLSKIQNELKTLSNSDTSIKKEVTEKLAKVDAALAEYSSQMAQIVILSKNAEKKKWIAISKVAGIIGGILTAAIPGLVALLQ